MGGFPAEPSDDDFIIIQCKNQSKQIVYKIAKQFRLIKEVLADGVEGEIPINFVELRTLDRIIAYCTHYINEPLPTIEKPLKSDDFKSLVPPFYYNYIESDDWNELFNLTYASNYLGVSSLTELCCAYIACKLRGIKTPKQLRNQFKVDRLFDPEEEKQIRLDNKWIEIDEFEDSKE